jgi:hypothetical protein
MAKKRKLKCTVCDGKFVEPCDALESVLMYGNPTPKQRGVWMWSLYIRGVPSRRFIGAKSGEHTDNGLIFNFCPYCAEPIDAPTLAKETRDSP